MVELADIVRGHGPAYLKRFGGRMLPSHRRALSDIVQCRTPALGGHIGQCLQCGQVHHFYHSCRNRACPKCHTAQTEAWTAKRREELLPVRYFHVVFTLPAELRGVARRHQRVVLGSLMRAAAHSLLDLARDPHYLGAQLAVMAVVHTWTRAMVWHPHVHCLVPGGGLADDGRTWREARYRFLVPVKALAKRFRGKFMAGLRRAIQAEELPRGSQSRPWVVYAKPSVEGGERVLRYLARYVHRVAISNERILSYDNDRVAFRYRDSRDGRTKTMVLPAIEFMRRYLQHVPPRGFHRVRYYGLWSPSNRKRLKHIRQSLLLAETTVADEALPADDEDNFQLPASLRSLYRLGCYRCPACRNGVVVIVARSFPPKSRAPPMPVVVSSQARVTP